ncbi:MAG: hypothetical protein ACTHMS_07695 [Jatrophihabitans sp.]|uniref:hypothetical protein n=1 Tax=Jatrophihabitans sp. TaxID=1932789 RepID=UPI003F7DAB63
MTQPSGSGGTTDTGFKVDTDKLQAVADKIQQLSDDITGNYIPGSYPSLSNARDIRTMLAPFWGPNHDIFADAYEKEYGALDKTFQIITTQLQKLQQAASATASGYGASDTNLAGELNKLKQQQGG